MNAPILARHLAGYLVGFFLFAGAVPYTLYKLSTFNPIPLPAGSGLRSAAALILVALGCAFALWSNAALLIRGEGGPTDAFNVAISPRTKHLVISGPYRYSRNPMLFGAFCAYFGLAVYWNSVQALAVLAFLVAAAKIYLRITEEKRLLRDFGKQYQEYRDNTPMILPRFAGKKKKEKISE